MFNIKIYSKNKKTSFEKVLKKTNILLKYYNANFGKFVLKLMSDLLKLSRKI